MTNEEAKSELMQIYMSLSEEKKQALDVLMAQNCDQCEVGNPCLYCEHEFKAQADRNDFYNWDAPIRHKADGKKSFKMRDATPEEQEAIDKYIKSISKPTGVNFGALEQEPCEDCISRQAVLDVVNNPLNIRLDEIIKQLPPVKPQEPKMGHWMEGGYDDYKWVCSECGYPRYEYYEKPKAKYCECCGCHMEIER